MPEAQIQATQEILQAISITDKELLKIVNRGQRGLGLKRGHKY